MASTATPPEAFARALFAHLGLSRVTDLSELLGRVGLRLREVDSRGFEGALVRAVGRPKGIVAVKSTIRERGRKRFTVLHEVGHYILPGHGTAECFCKAEDIETWRRGTPSRELEANRFAAEMLLPRAEVARVVRRQTSTIAAAKTLCEEFDASLTAATLKAVEVTGEACSVVWSQGGTIRWCRPNDNFRPYIRVNEKLSSESLAYQLLTGGGTREADGTVPARAWVNSYDLDPADTLWEDSIHMPFYAGVLTILTVTRPLGGGGRKYDKDEGEGGAREFIYRRYR
jgi:hypothetical protein